MINNSRFPPIYITLIFDRLTTIMGRPVLPTLLCVILYYFYDGKNVPQTVVQTYSGALRHGTCNFVSKIW